MDELFRNNLTFCTIGEASRGVKGRESTDYSKSFGYAFVEEALPLLEQKGTDLFVYYVASAELFDLLPHRKQEKVFPEEHAKRAMGITGFTLPTMYRWIRSDWGREMTLHPYREGHFLGSGQAHMVLAEAGLDGKSQFKTIMKYLKEKG